MEFHKRLKECRQAKGLTQRQMSDTLNISERQYNRYENGHAEPSINNLYVIGKTLNTSIDYLLSLHITDNL